MSKRKRRLPPKVAGELIETLTVRQCSVGSFQSPTSGTLCIGIIAEFDLADERTAKAVLPLINPESVDMLIQALLRHKRDVWPEAP